MLVEVNKSWRRMSPSYYAVGSWDDWTAFHLLCFDKASRNNFEIDVAPNAGGRRWPTEGMAVQDTGLHGAKLGAHVIAASSARLQEVASTLQC